MSEVGTSEIQSRRDSNLVSTSINFPSRKNNARSASRRRVNPASVRKAYVLVN